MFVRDALRRTVTGSSVQQSDVDELVQLLKKENGDNRITLTALPLDGKGARFKVDERLRGKTGGARSR